LQEPPASAAPRGAVPVSNGYGSETIPLRFIATPRLSKPLQPALLVGQLDMMWTVRSVACVAPASILLSTI